MERELLTIEPANDGWAISGCRSDQRSYPTKVQAIHRAALLSYTHHMMTGEPTGVMVQMQSGEAVLTGLCG